MSELTDIEYTRGDTEPIGITIKTSAGLPVDITDWTFKLTVSSEKAPEDDTTQIFQIEGTLDADPATGKVTFEPADGQIDQVGTFYYDIQRTNGSGKKKTIKRGYKFKVLQDITK